MYANSQALVLVYKDLLDFYFAAAEILEHKAVAVRLSTGGAQKLTTIVSSFCGHTQALNTQVGMEIYAIIQRLANTVTEDLGLFLLVSADFSPVTC